VASKQKAVEQAQAAVVSGKGAAVQAAKSKAEKMRQNAQKAAAKLAAVPVSAPVAGVPVKGTVKTLVTVAATPVAVTTVSTAPALPKASNLERRQKSLAVVARSVRGVNRNLTLEHIDGVEVRIVRVDGKGKTFTAFDKATNTVIGPVTVDNEPIKSIGQVTYGRWVELVRGLKTPAPVKAKPAKKGAKVKA